MKHIILALSLTGLTACGGGETSLTPFSSFSTLPENGQTSIQGKAITASYTADLGTGAVTLGTVSGPNNATGVITTTNGLTTGLSISAPGSSISIDENDGDEAIDAGLIIAAGNDSGSKTLVIADNEELGYEYQSFGVWVNGYNTGSGTVGVATFGASTSESTVASLSGDGAIYNGISTGLLVDVDDQPYLTVSDITVRTDFNEATITSSNTVGANLNNASDLPAPSDFDFEGTGTVSGDGFTAEISGNIVDGTADGIFYGPNAEEVGGTFSSSSGGTTYAGSFGAN